MVLFGMRAIVSVVEITHMAPPCVFMFVIVLFFGLDVEPTFLVHSYCVHLYLALFVCLIRLNVQSVEPPLLQKEEIFWWIT